MRVRPTLFVLIAVLSLPLSAWAAKSHKVVFDLAINDKASFKVLQKNVQSLKEAFGKEPVEIEVVAYGAGLDLLGGTDPEVEAGLKALAGEGVHIAVCGITAKAKKLDAKALGSSCSLVDGGLAELVRRQEAGWAYIKVAAYGK